MAPIRTPVRPKRRPKPENPSLLFLRKFLQQGVRVASVAPSSKTLAAAICRHVDSAHPQTIVELGAGTGPVTAEVCRRMHPDSRLIALEIDADLARCAAQSFPQAQVLCADVRQLPDILAQHGVTHIDLLLNGLPTPSLPRSINQVVLETFHHLAPEGWFSQLTVMPYVYMPLYRKLFERVHFDLVFRNVPPGGVYHCQYLRSDYLRHLPGAKPRKHKVAAARKS